MKLQYKK